MINEEWFVRKKHRKNVGAQLRIFNDFGVNILTLKTKYFMFDVVRGYEHFKEYWEHSSYYSKYKMRC